MLILFSIILALVTLVMFTAIVCDGCKIHKLTFTVFILFIGLVTLIITVAIIGYNMVTSPLPNNYYKEDVKNVEYNVVKIERDDNNQLLSIYLENAEGTINFDVKQHNHIIDENLIVGEVAFYSIYSLDENLKKYFVLYNYVCVLTKEPLK